MALAISGIFEAIYIKAVSVIYMVKFNYTDLWYQVYRLNALVSFLFRFLSR